MAYLAAADIERELSYDFGISTEPNETEIAVFITQVEAELNGVLASVSATVPVSEAASPGTFAMAKQAALWGVCARVMGAFAGIVTGESPKETIYWDRYREFLDRVTMNPGILYDAAFDTTTLRVQGLDTGDDDYHEPVFAMDDQF